MDLETNIGSNNNQVSNILENTVCLSLELRKLGVRKKVASEQVNKTDAADEALHVSKEILQSEYLERIASLDGEIRKYVAARTVPSPFRSGVYLLSLGVLAEVDAKLQELSRRRDDLVAFFLEEYEHQADAARRRLGSLWDPRDYPDKARVARTFGMKASYVELATPGKLRTVSPEIYERACAQAREEIANAAEQIKTMLIDEAAGLLDHAIERLERKPDGTQKTFRDTLIGNVESFLETFDCRNVGGWADLARVVGDMRRVVRGGNVDAQALRENVSLADHVRTRFTEIKASLDGMMTARPRRKIDFTE